jgi:hypothetical protein
MFSDTKNRTGMAGSGKAVSSILELPFSMGAIDGKMFVQEVVPVDTLTTKVPSVLYSSNF